MAASHYAKLYVGNLPWITGSRELKNYFEQFGRVIKANVIFDTSTGFSRGFGFVTFAESDDAATTLAQRRHFIDGENVKVAYT